MIVYELNSPENAFTAYYIRQGENMYYYYGDWGWSTSMYGSLAEFRRIELDSGATITEIPIDQCDLSVQHRVYEFLLGE